MVFQRFLEVVRREAANTQGWPAPNNTTKAAISFGSLKKDIEKLNRVEFSEFVKNVPIVKFHSLITFPHFCVVVWNICIS